jgi:hypothetical protein
MRTSMKAILTAMSVAVLASPAMAQTLRNHHVPLATDLSTDNVFWGEEDGHRHAYGSAGDPQAGGRLAPGVVIGGAQRRILDCVHVTFPQCSGD